MSEYGIIPPTGANGEDWPASHNLPQGKEGGISYGGWTDGNEGYIQQTFLGASIEEFGVTAGFGDTTSTLTLQLVNDEYNKSDGLGFGQGDDVYHNGNADVFRPPIVGTPVYFKFGKNFATVEQAYRKTWDDLTGFTTVPAQDNFPTITVNKPLENVPQYHYLISETDTQMTFEDRSALWDIDYGYRGRDHFVFGGILQSWSENTGTDRNGYAVQVSDPREILSNVTVLLNNYQGTTYNNKNLLNVYGFLEYDPSDGLLATLEGPSMLSKNILTKNVDLNGVITYVGDDTYRYANVYPDFTNSSLPESFPITGQGFSRRGDQGIPWYRVNQALTALFNYDGALPNEYIEAGFGGTIDFRGFKYVVDFSGLPLALIPQMYFLDFDQINMLDLAQELCDIISHDLFVSLLPVIDHPSTRWLYWYNQQQISLGAAQNIVAGVIRIDAIDRSLEPKYGAIKSYIDTLEAAGVDVKGKDIGFELSNITTDKFVVGAQEVNMYYFNNNRDRNNLQLRRELQGLPNDFEFVEEAQWSLDTALKQQILPFYGFLGRDAVTIPRGFGAYQQIMLDATTLFAYGVGNYYIATEIELRAALKSYEDWARFLTSYDEIYMEDLNDYGKNFYKDFVSNLDFSEADAIEAAADPELQTLINGAINELKEGNYGVSVPRCVFNSDRDYMGPDGYPASPCAPPYGYPLYYKRAEKIGIATAGPAGFYDQKTQLMTNYETLRKRLKEKLANDGVVVTNDDNLEEITQDHLNNLNDQRTKIGAPTQANAEKIALIQQQAITYNELLGDSVKIKQALNDPLVKNMKSIGLDGEKNAKKVYEFVRKVAEENLGRKFLVKIPKKCNLTYASDMAFGPGNEVLSGPFGFRPQPINSGYGYSETVGFTTNLSELQQFNLSNDREIFTHYLDVGSSGYSYGALKNNFNPVSDRWEFNYEPSIDGGFFSFDIYDRPISYTEGLELDDSKLPIATRRMLIPRDITNITNDGNRVKCYVRFDNSQFLDFSQISKDSYTQSKVTVNGNIPDILEELDNTGSAKFSLDRVKELQTGDFVKSCAYVTCDLDPQLYLAPRTEDKSVTVYGREVKYVAAPPVILLNEVVQDDDGCTTFEPYVDSISKVFSPADNGGSDFTNVNNSDFVRYYDNAVDGNLVITEKSRLDPDHVYALITLPGRIEPTIESRYLDSQAYAVNANQIKHNMTQDVTRGPAGFDKPAPVEIDPDRDAWFTTHFNPDCDDIIQYGQRFAAAAQAQMEGMTNRAKFGSLIKNISKYKPSPVYPDLVAIPLISKERCYGPWLSSAVTNVADNRIRYSNIGGKVEFVKDENLSPWNFAGYQLMDEAGKVQAQFSNSLQLFSEKGGFAIPEAPTGIALARALKDGGPLVTSIDVAVRGNEFVTTVKMDLYSASFGKLQKQKEGAIANIGRERQKIIDANNARIRSGLGKGVSKADFMAPMRQAGQALQGLNEEVKQDLKYLKVTFDGDTRRISMADDNKVYKDTVDNAENASFMSNSRAVPLEGTIFDTEEEYNVKDNGK